MAKKTVAKKTTSKKASTKSATKSASKPAPKNAGKKASKKAAAAKGKSKSKAKKQPYMTTSGKGDSPAEIGKKLVTMVNSHTPEKEIWGQLFHKKFESIEGDGSTWAGMKAVAKKGEDWMAQHTVHGVKVEGPFVGATGFGVRYEMDIEAKATGQRFQMAEVGVYTVKNGKVVREEFMYGGM